MFINGWSVNEVWVCVPFPVCEQWMSHHVVALQTLLAFHEYIFLKESILSESCGVYHFF